MPSSITIGDIVLNPNAAADLQIIDIILHDGLVTAIVKSHTYCVLVALVSTIALFDFIARERTADCAGDRGGSSARPLANLMPKQAADYAANNSASATTLARARYSSLCQLD
jgi:hypothetical protein